MFTVKVIKNTDDRTFEEVYECEHYKRELNTKYGKEGQDFAHYLSLYGVGHFDDGIQIDLYEMVEDTHGKYEQDVFIMNDEGKTIDRY